MQEARDRYIKGSLTPPGPPTQHGIYASPEWTGQPYPSLGWQNIRQDQEPPEGWPRPPKFNKPGDELGPLVQYGDPITPQTVKAGYGFIDNGIIEKNLYFYHPDHLGSSSYITDREGRITQHTEYIAFGEVLFEEHSTSRTMPYLFNGKELDSETNLTYFGARYLDMKTSLWLNTDPLSGYNPIQETEHYIDGQHNNGVFNPMNHNTYGYTYNNPIKWVDPNGKQTTAPIVNGQTNKIESLLNKATSILGKRIPILRILNLPPPIELIPEVTVSSGIAGLLGRGDFGAKTIDISVNTLNSKATTRADILSSTIEERKNNTGHGSYTINFSNGKKYHGKGNLNRAVQSAIEHSVFGSIKDENTVVPKHINWSASPTEREAYKAEHTRMQEDKTNDYPQGYRNPINYNKRNSPGYRYKIQDGQDPSK